MLRQILKGYIKVHCDMLGYAVVVWAFVVLVCLDIFGYVWVRLGMFEHVNLCFGMLKQVI